jgi:hypothetical protein
VLIDRLGAERQRVDAIICRRLMQPYERIHVVPVPARRVPPIHHDDARIGLGEQRVREGHARRTAADDEIVCFERSSGHLVSALPFPEMPMSAHPSGVGSPP